MRTSGDPNFAIHVEYCTPIQYSCHVFATIFRCRFHGDRLDSEAIRAAPLHGELIVHRRGMGRIAKLLAPDGVSYVAPVLDRARLVALDARGLLLSGVERYPGRTDKRDGPSYLQTWWCVPTQRPAQRPDTRADEVRRAAEVARTMSAHYVRRRG